VSSISQTPSEPSECLNRNQDSSDQTTFFQSSTVQFWRAPANCSLFFLFVVEMSDSAVVAYPPQGCVCWLHKCFAAYLSWRAGRYIEFVQYIDIYTFLKRCEMRQYRLYRYSSYMILLHLKNSRGCSELLQSK